MSVVSTRGWNRRAAVIVARASFASIAVWIALATVLRATGPDWLYRVVDLPFAFVCHRIPERVISVMGAPMPLCSRCLGLWGGLSIAAAIAWPAIDPRKLRWLLPLAGLVMLIDVLTQDLGLHPIWHATRLLGAWVRRRGALPNVRRRDLRPRDRRGSRLPADRDSPAAR